MPPKKKAGGKGKKKGKAKKEGNGGELSVAEMYKRTVQEVETLKHRLAERQEYARRSRASEEVMRDRMLEAKSIVEEERVSKREITNDLARQYKTMQIRFETRIEFLETQVRRLQSELDKTKSELQKVTEERDRILREKEEEAERLNTRLHAMEKSYEAILQDALDALATKVEAARCKWDRESREVELQTLQILHEFGRGVGNRRTTNQ